jgi:hypothetical protein
LKYKFLTIEKVFKYLKIWLLKYQLYTSENAHVNNKLMCDDVHMRSAKCV